MRLLLEAYRRKHMFNSDKTHCFLLGTTSQIKKTTLGKGGGTRRGETVWFTLTKEGFELLYKLCEEIEWKPEYGGLIFDQDII